MNKSSFYWLTFLIALLPFCELNAQLTVYPGDANNNGIVNNIDVLYTGYSFGTLGPSRVYTDAEFEPQSVQVNWSNVFPDMDSTSYAFSDANGDGVINSPDLLTIYRNYGATRPPVITDEFPDVPLSASQLRLEKEPEPTPLIPGSQFSIPIYLNDIDLPLALNGLAFSLEYDERVVKEIWLEWEDSWFNSDSSWYGLQVPTQGLASQLEIAMTRFGDDPAIGGGIFGSVNIIVEEDLIELLSAPTDTVNVLLAIKQIRGMGKNFVPIPIGGDEYTFTVYHQDARPNKVKQPQIKQFKVYPNPARDYLQIETLKNIQSIRIYDLLGRPLKMETNLDSNNIQLPVADLPPGVYLLQIRTEEGMGYREVLIE